MIESQTNPTALAAELALAEKQRLELTNEKRRLEGVMASTPKEDHTGRAAIRSDLFRVESQLATVKAFLRGPVRQGPKAEAESRGSAAVLILVARGLRDARRWSTPEAADRSRRELLLEIEMFLDRGGAQ